MLRFMIVDESPVIRQVAKRILSGMDMLVTEAETGEQAMKQARADLPDVVILDAAMADALDTIAGLRDLQKGGEIRIYYCLVDADLKTMMQGKRAGADDFFLKPFDRRAIERTFGGLQKAA